MSDDNTSPNSSALSYSTAASPTDTRTQPRRFEPITDDQGDDEGNGESTRTPGTVRRSRPLAISTSRGGIYGMFSFYSRVELLIVSKAPWIPTTPRKNPLSRVNKHLYRMGAAKVYRVLHGRLASKYFLLNLYHQ